MSRRTPRRRSSSPAAVGASPRAAHGEERDRLWERWRQIDKGLDSYAARRSMETAVVIFEPADRNP